MKKNILIGAMLVLTILAVIVAGCTVPQTVQNPDGSTGTNYVVDPKFTTGLEAAGALNTTTGAIGVNPYASLIGWVIGVIGAAAGWVAKIRTDRANKLLKVVVQGVEQSKSEAAKSAIEAHSANAGVKLELDTAVQKIVSGNG